MVILGVRVENETPDVCCHYCGDFIPVGDDLWHADDDNMYCMLNCLEETSPNGAEYVWDVYARDEQRWEDTQSLQDMYPEEYGYITNQNPYGMEGGY